MRPPSVYAKRSAAWRRPPCWHGATPTPSKDRRDPPGHRRLLKGAVVLAKDEIHINLPPWVRSTWILAGQWQPVITPGKKPAADDLRRD